MSDIARGSLSHEEVVRMTDALTRHYGEPVRPVSHYCAAFEAWAKALQVRKDEEEAVPLDQRDESLRRAADACGELRMPIYKSSMLARLIYGGERPRIEKCPIHKGTWCGLPHAGNDCPHGCQLTGWLPVAR